jgi:cyclophilin family peptidyl-prolyl cis-trans isomerase
MRSAVVVWFVVVLALVAAVVIVFTGTIKESTSNKEVDAAEKQNQRDSKSKISLKENIIPSLRSTPGPVKTPPSMQIDARKTYTATLHTSVGDITLALNAKATPITVNNFVYLAREGFYDNTVFHRVIENFMIQGGDPKGDGTGGPGYRFDDEKFEGEYTAGTVAMANAGPNTNGSQFFIMHASVPLPKKYVIFGRVQSGQDVVDRIATAPVKMNPATGERSIPVKPVTIHKVIITEESALKP